MFKIPDLLVMLLGVTAVFLTTSAPAAPGAKDNEVRLAPPTQEEMILSANRLKQLGVAWHNFHSAMTFMPNNVLGKDGKPLLSWRVQILPYIEHVALYHQFRLDEPWDSDHNKKLIDKMPTIYAPIRVKADPGMTFYQSFVGAKAVIQPGKKVSLAAIQDGTSNTLMVVEAAKPVIWTKPDDLPFDGKELPKLGGLFDGRFHAVFCDGHVERFKPGIDADLLRSLIDPNDGAIIDYRNAVEPLK